jgi:hypothetical protein
MLGPKHRALLGKQSFRALSLTLRFLAHRHLA